MLRLKGTYNQIVGSIHSQNIPKEWTYNLDYTMLNLIIAMLGRYLEQAKKHVVIDNEEQIVEVRDRLCQIIKWKQEFSPYTLGEKEKEYVTNTFQMLAEILETLWW